MMGASFLAKQNSFFCCFLNRIINNTIISPSCYIPKSIKIPHGNVIIGDDVVIGENVTIFQYVTLGSLSDKNNDYPTIEDDVTIGCNSVILGEVTIPKGRTIKCKSFILGQ